VVNPIGQAVGFILKKLWLEFLLSKDVNVINVGDVSYFDDFL
jgi:hypothetical protein